MKYGFGVIIALSVLASFAGAALIPNVGSPTISFHRHCPWVKGASIVDATQYAGRWYEIGQFFDIEHIGDCTTKDLTANSNGTFTVLDASRNMGLTTTEVGLITLLPFPARFKAEYSLPGGGLNVIRMTATSADPNTHVLAYSCKEFIPNIMIYERLWFWSRIPIVNSSVHYSEIVQPLLDKNIPVITNFMLTNQAGCQYVDEPN